MKCPFCSVPDTKVVDSRTAEDGSSIRRRRKCDACGKRFTTYEKIEVFPLMVVKKDQTREAYDRAKIEAGIMQAIHKLPISMESVHQMLEDVETDIFAKADKEVDTSEIGEIVMKHLKALDEVAYVRFASVYREFTDVDNFAEELKKLLKKNKKGSRV